MLAGSMYLVPGGIKAPKMTIAKNIIGFAKFLMCNFFLSGYKFSEQQLFIFLEEQDKIGFSINTFVNYKICNEKG